LTTTEADGTTADSVRTSIRIVALSCARARCETLTNASTRKAKRGRKKLDTGWDIALCSVGWIQMDSRRSSCAFAATTIVLSDISTAPTAAGSTMPQGARTPAASGIAKMLYPAAHHRF